MTNKKKKIDPAISEHFRGMQKKSWAKRKANILKRAKVDNKSNTNLG